MLDFNQQLQLWIILSLNMLLSLNYFRKFWADFGIFLYIYYLFFFICHFASKKYLLYIFIFCILICIQFSFRNVYFFHFVCFFFVNINLTNKILLYIVSFADFFFILFYWILSKLAANVLVCFLYLF